MRMQECPHCGADNSLKRKACYHCQRPLNPPNEDSPKPAASSRWEAIEPLSAAPKPRVLRPAQDGFSSPDKPVPAKSEETARPASYMPMVRSSLKHVRRMGIFFQQLHTLVRSGIPLASAGRELSHQAPRALRGLAAEMTEAAEQGKPISSVMERHRDLLYPWHIGLVHAAEAAGFLPEAFGQIAHAYELEWETRAALRLRLFFYVVLGLPGILLAMPAIMMLREPIPAKGWTAQLVMDSLLHHARTVSLPIVIVLVAGVLIWQALTATVWFQGVQQRVVLRLPLVGKVAKAAALDRYLATLGLMLRGGGAVGEAAEQAALAAGNSVLTPKLLALGPALREGVPVAEALASTGEFDRETLGMAATGEMSGSLPDMLARAAGYYREEHDAKRRMLIRTAQVLLGVAWLCVAGAVLLFAVRSYFDFAFRVFDWMLE
ncbi:MAG: type II secretion system F family protein [Proteobacteria bacterium]|nr:type II secretion system F family protein [Pseudomonadota bacterium]